MNRETHRLHRLREQYPDPGTDPIARLRHTLDVHADTSPDDCAVYATQGIHETSTGLTYGDLRALLVTIDLLNGELMRATHGHYPGPGICEQRRCNYCRYCGKEKPCPCYTADGRHRGFSLATAIGTRKDFIENALISAVSTTPMHDADGYETAVGLPVGGFMDTGQWHPVERYETAEEAEQGHERWLAAAPTLTEVTDLGPPGEGTATVVDLVAELAQLKKGS